jgi:NAD+ diphosphatase
MQKALLGPWPQLGYVDSVIARAADRRTDIAFLEACAASEACGCYIVSGEMVVLKRAGDFCDPLFLPAEIAQLAMGPERIFLGLQAELARFGHSLAADAIASLKEDARFVVTDLRSVAVQGLVPPEHLAPLAEAKALLHWHARHRFCSNCGHPTNALQGGWRRDCPQCGTQHFPRTDPVAIMLAVRGDLCLLGRQSRFAEGVWSCLAGFIEPGETIEDAVRRETLEEAGIVCGRVRYLSSQPWPFPSSLMIGCHAEAVTTAITVDTDELEDVRWFSRAEAAAMLLRNHPDGLITPPPIAIAHHIIRAWVEKGDDVFA